LYFIFKGESKMTDNDDSFSEDIDELLEKYGLGFKRPERLDVKKPGPPFDNQKPPEPPAPLKGTFFESHNSKSLVLLNFSVL
jgi:hypothetical protein